MRQLLLLIRLAVAGLAALPAAAAPIQVVATNPILLDWVRQIGGDRIEAHLAGSAGDFHHYDPTPADVRRLARADLIVANGAGLEPWLDRVMNGSGSRARRFFAATGLPLIPAGATLRLVPGIDGEPLPPCCAADAPPPGSAAELAAEIVAPSRDGNGHDHGDDHAHDHDHAATGDRGTASPDPHLWLDPRLAQGVVTLLADVLAEIDPAGAEIYGSRADAYAARLAEMDRWIETELAAVPTDRRVLVTYHHAFAYFARRYRLALPGSLLGSVHSEAREPGARSAAAFVDFIRRNQLPAIFGEQGQDDRLLRELGRSAGVPVGWLHAESLPADDPTYEGLMRQNALAVRAALVPAAR